MKELHVVGWSGAGKTTLILDLIRLLHQDGIAVAVVKHHSDRLSPAGKDSARFFASGTPTILMAADGILEMATEPTLADVKSRLRQEVDLLLVEGIKEDPGAKIWVGKGCPAALPGLLAVVGGTGPAGCLALREGDAEAVYQQVVQPIFGRVDND